MEPCRIDWRSIWRTSGVWDADAVGDYSTTRVRVSGAGDAGCAGKDGTG
jgi:hypothetical protein